MALPRTVASGLHARPQCTGTPIALWAVLSVLLAAVLWMVFSDAAARRSVKPNPFPRSI